MAAVLVAAASMTWPMFLPSVTVVFASSTGVAGAAGNGTLVQAEELVPNLPVSNLVAIILCCVLVVLTCVCLFVCARQQMAVRQTSRRAASAIHPTLQAKIDAARRGWRKGGGSTVGAMGPNASLTALALHGADAAELIARASELQRQQMAALAGASMGGLGACRYEHLRDPEDFQDEPWATPGTRESLKRSGHILDVVLTSQHTMYMAGLSGIIPCAIMAGLPFHKLLLRVLHLRDWYGPIVEVDFDRCMTIAAAGVAIHLAAYLLAKRIFDYDRTPSIAAQKAEYRAVGKSTLAGGAAGGAAIAVTQPVATSHRAAAPVAATAASSIAMDGAAASVTSPRSDQPPMFTGKDPALWPLRLFCVLSLLSYGLLGFQCYVSCDESGGRQYGLTSTPRRFWPPTAGRAPAITFIIACIVGGVAMVPIGFSLKLLALFHPRRVHPNLMQHI